MAYNGAWFRQSHYSAPQSDRLLQRRDGEFEIGGSCPAPGSPGTKSGGSGGTKGPPVRFEPGPPGPLCTADCGKLCQGYYCDPSPSGTPPDFFLPSGADPAPTGLPITGLPDPTTTAPTGVPSNYAPATTWSSCALGIPRGQSACQTHSACDAIFIDYTSLPSCTPEPTATKEPEPEPMPSGKICLGSFAAAFPNGGNEWSLILFDHDKPHGDELVSIRIDDFAHEDACDLARDQVQFALGCVKAHFEDSGPYWDSVGCGMQLVVNDKRYPAVSIGSQEAPCFGTCTAGPGFGTAYGSLRYLNVPICE